MEKVCVVPCSTPVAAAGQGRSSSLAKRKVLLVSSSVVQACMPWMAAPKEREEGRDGGVWAEGPGVSARRRRAGQAQA